MLAQGQEVADFETEFAAHFTPGRQAVAVNSGTSGLHIGLHAARRWQTSRRNKPSKD